MSSNRTITVDPRVREITNVLGDLPDQSVELIRVFLKPNEALAVASHGNLASEDELDLWVEILCALTFCASNNTGYDPKVLLGGLVRKVQGGVQ